MKRKLDILLSMFDLTRKMPIEAADEFSQVLLSILKYLTDFCFNFLNFHGETLVCNDTYKELLKGSEELKKLKYQWLYFSLTGAGASDMTAKKLISLKLAEVSECQCSNCSNSRKSEAKEKSCINKLCTCGNGSDRKKNQAEGKSSLNQTSTKPMYPFKPWEICRNQLTCITTKVPCANIFRKK